MGKAQYKVVGGKLIKVQLAHKDRIIKRIKITGDFFLHPEEIIDELEESLKGKSLRESDLFEAIKSFIEDREATLLGASYGDFVKCIIMAGEKDD